MEKRMPQNARLLVGGRGSKALKRTFGRSDMVFVESLEEMRTELDAIAAQHRGTD